MFLSRTQTQNLLMSDPDGFAARLTLLDLEARHAQTKADYIQKSVKSAEEFTPYEKDVLWREATRAQEALEGTRYSGIPWRFAKAQYEEGLPHTRGNVIFLSGITDYTTLVHEMIHVVQKVRGPRVPPGYKLTDVNFKNLRANPDTDGRVWFKGNIPADSFYKSSTPMGISDVVQYVEHPFEAEAYAFRSDRGWEN